MVSRYTSAGFPEKGGWDLLIEKISDFTMFRYKSVRKD
jgi:hypothetical protein